MKKKSYFLLLFYFTFILCITNTYVCQQCQEGNFYVFPTSIKNSSGFHSLSVAQVFAAFMESLARPVSV